MSPHQHTYVNGATMVTLKPTPLLEKSAATPDQVELFGFCSGKLKALMVCSWHHRRCTKGTQAKWDRRTKGLHIKGVGPILEKIITRPFTQTCHIQNMSVTTFNSEVRAVYMSSTYWQSSETTIPTSPKRAGEVSKLWVPRYTRNFQFWIDGTSRRWISWQFESETCPKASAKGVSSCNKIPFIDIDIPRWTSKP